jgi:tetratricopeptide (TPR) repeat protein
LRPTVIRGLRRQENNGARYNEPVQVVLWAVAFAFVSAVTLAQSSASSCPADLPIDEIIGEMHKQQAKKKHHVAIPLPQVLCVGGWCRDLSKTPPTLPEPAPRVKVSNGENRSSPSPASNQLRDKCDNATEMALEAAHDVEVGDYYFDAKRYSAALLRYQDALGEKPGDIAIYVRLGRVLEKLNRVPQAIEQYKAAQKLAGPAKWSEEAKTALMRLQSPPSS